MATVGLLRTLRHLPLCVYQSLNITAKSSPHLVHKWTGLARPFSSKTAIDPKKSVSKAATDPKKSVSKPAGLPKQRKGGKKGMSQACKTPKRIGFPKQHRGGMKGISHQGNDICFGRYALQVLEPAWITARQVEAGRRAMLPSARRGGKIWVRIFPDKPVTEKPIGKRMGSGKGDPVYNVAVVKPGRIIYEMSGVTENIARNAIKIAASKMHIRTQFILSG